MEVLAPFETTWEFWRLLKLGFPFESFQGPVQLMKQTSWSTKVTEQGHKPASSIVKAHDQYGSETISTRSMMGAMVPLLTRTRADKTIEKLQAKLASLDRRNPNYIQGRQMYIKDLVELSTRLKSQGRSIAPRVQQTIVKRSGKCWEDNSPAFKKQFEDRAATLRDARWQELSLDRHHVRDRIILERQRAASVQPVLGGPLQMSSCKFSDVQVSAFNELFESGVFAGVALEELRAKATQQPMLPTDVLLGALATCADPVRSQSAKPFWLSPVCNNRDTFADSMFRFACGIGGADILLRFAYATQRPLMVCFQGATRTTQPLSSSSSSSWEDDALNWHEHYFEVQLMSFIYSDEIAHLVGRSVSVLMHCVFDGGQSVVSDADWVPIVDVIAALPGKIVAGLEASGPRRMRPSAHEIADYPWLLDFMGLEKQVSSKKMHGPCGKAPSKADALPALATEANEVDADAVFALLWEKRREYEAIAPAIGSAFRVHILGGVWTSKHLAKPFDAFRGQASGEAVETWCDRFGFNHSSRFTVNLGEYNAFQLAKAWCKHMQHWYDMYRLADDHAFVYPPVLVRWEPSVDFVNVMNVASPACLLRCNEIVLLEPV